MPHGDKHQTPKPVWRCYPFIWLGTHITQVALLLMGGIFICIVYQIDPNKALYPNVSFHANHVMDYIFPIYIFPGLVLVAGFLVAGFVEARTLSKLLRGGEIASAEIARVQEGEDSESIEYRVSFKTAELHGGKLGFELVRAAKDLVVGQSVRVLINRTMGIGLLEPDLPGGITFANVYGVESIPLKCWGKILVIPFLSIVPLLSLNGSISTFIQNATKTIGLPILFWWTFVLQIIWYHRNRRHLFPGKPFVLYRRCQ